MKFKKPGNKYGSDSVEYFQKTDEMRSAWIFWENG